MLTLAHAYLDTGRFKGSLLPFVLSRLTADLDAEFCRFADCGAGIGHTSQAYASLLDKHLSDEAKADALLACFEPLPENFQQLQKNVTSQGFVKLHQEAVSNVAGSVDFYVPSRMGSGSTGWTEGTSYGGSLQKKSASERVTVDAVRLEDAYREPFDFVKLDLQGGELKAIQGLGNLLPLVKLLYVETQLLSRDTTTDYLNKNGFITLFDDIQFGLKAGTAAIPHGVLQSLGIRLTRTHLPTTSGFPLICWGHFAPDADLFDAATLSFKPAVVQKLLDAGVNYMQTDVLAINPSIFPQVLRYFTDPSESAPTPVQPRKGKRRYGLFGPRDAG